MQVREILKALRTVPEERRSVRTVYETRRNAAQIKKICTQPFALRFLEDAKQTADERIRYPIAVLPYHAFARFFKDGNRTEYEKWYFARRKELGACALLCWSGALSYLERLENLLWAVCEESTWALPAHIEDVVREYHISSDGRKKRVAADTLDLFCCETAFALAEILFLLEDILTTGVKNRIREEIDRRVWKSLCAPFPNPIWEEIHNNWTAVCAGSLGGAALYLIEEEAVLAPILSRMLSCVEDYICSFPEDGACAEGVGYWSYGMGYLLAFGDMLKLRTDGAINLFNHPRLKNIAEFPQKCYFEDGSSVSFADGSCHDLFHIGLSCYLAKEYGGVVVPPIQCAAGFHDNSCYNWCFLFRDIFWLEETLAGKNASSHRLDVLKDAQWISVQGGHDVGFAAKGGTNGDPHNHNDLGSFLYHRGGRPLLEDLGAGEYNREYFSPARYKIFCNSSLGHSVPILAGQEQGTGSEFAAADVEYGAGAAVKFQLKHAYPIGTVDHFIREFQFRQESGVLYLRDSFHFDKPETSVTERFITACQLEITPNGVWVGGENGALLQSATLPHIRAHAHSRHNGKKTVVYSIDYELCCREGETVFSLTVTPYPEKV